MKKATLILAITAFASCAPSLKAAVTIAHVENAGAGQFFDSAGGALAAGGVSVGFFTTAPQDTAFGTTITNWVTLLAAGYQDVRTLSGVTFAGLDWDFPLPIGGSVSNIPFSSVPQNTQLYLFAFNGGLFNTVAPAASFLGSTQWSVVKDNADLSPADLGTKSTVLSTVVGTTEVLIGTDNGVNVNMAALIPVPEPATFAFGVMVAFAGLVRQRRQRHQV